MSLFLGLQVQQDLVLGPIFGGNPDDHMGVFLLQVLDLERGLLPFRVGFPAKSVWDLHVFPCPILEVISVLTEAGQPPPLPIIQAALGPKIPEPIVVRPDCE